MTGGDPPDFLALTRQIGVQSHASRRGAAILAQFDGLSGRERFAAEFECLRPRFVRCSGAGAVTHPDPARNPIFSRKRLRARQASIVPLTLELTISSAAGHQWPQYRGKTVALKTTAAGG